MHKNSAYFQVFLYSLCGLVVLLFVNLYGVWSLADQLLPAPVIKLLPIIAVFVFISAILIYYSRFKKIKTIEVNWPMLWAGGVVCILALLIPDSQFPVKRVHVIEYMLLAALVRYAMSYHLQGRLLLCFSVMAAMMFGIHDELLQGMHPSRTFGLRDMTVNSVAALGGGLIWHGGSLFIRPAMFSKKAGQKEIRIVSAYIFWLWISVVAFVLPLTVYRQETIPYWPLIPVAGATVLWAMYSEEIEGQLKYGCTVVNCLIYLFLIYPVAINGSSYIFY